MDDDYTSPRDDHSPRHNLDSPSTVEIEGVLEKLAARITLLESSARASGSHQQGLSLGYALGMVIAVVLSWSRNASILWCIGHGLLSWAYVLYFAWSRK